VLFFVLQYPVRSVITLVIHIDHRYYAVYGQWVTMIIYGLPLNLQLTRARYIVATKSTVKFVADTFNFVVAGVGDCRLLTKGWQIGNNLNIYELRDDPVTRDVISIQTMSVMADDDVILTSVGLLWTSFRLCRQCVRSQSDAVDFVDFWQNRPCWIRLHRQCVPGLNSTVVTRFKCHFK